MTVHHNRFLVNKINRFTEFQFYWYYYSTSTNKIGNQCICWFYSQGIITTLHFTALHNASPPIFHFTGLFDVSSQRFKTPSLLFTYKYFLNLFLKIYDLREKVASVSAGSLFHSFIVLFTKKYLNIPVFCFLALNLQS